MKCIRTGTLFLTVLTLALSACGNSPPPLAAGDAAGGDVPASLPPTGVQVQSAPFRLCFNAEVCTAESATLAVPTPYLYVEGPRPQVNPSTLNAFPAFGWVVGRTENRLIPTYIWQGNRLSGRDSGLLYQVTGVVKTTQFSDRSELQLSTNYAADPTPALLILRALPSGAIEAHLLPPPGMRAEGIAVTLFTLDSPAGEGLFGMGARKDFFNQRGKLRNVWTEQQNTGLGSLKDLDFGGAGAPVAPPTPELLDALGINADVDDPLFTEPRTSFPNGAQAAYWVEAFVMGSRGWAAWTTQSHFQRIDLAATLAGKLRWQVVDSDELTLLFADGGIEAASRKYTRYWGRGPKPGVQAWQPWIDTLNQGEGEAAPNGQGFWGGQRARCEVEDFLAKSTQYQIPFGMIGIEGWQVIAPTHPNCLAMSTQTICENANGFPSSEAAWKAEVAAGTDFHNSIPMCADASRTFFDYLRDRGYKVAGYWNFFHTNPACAGDTAAGCMDDTLSVPLASKQGFYTAREAEFYVKSASNGQDHQITTNRGGISNLIDFTSDAVVPFWSDQLARMFDAGIDSFMHDFGELTTDDMRFAEGENITASHNLFAFKYQKAARLAIDRYARQHPERKDFTPYFFARAGMTGSCAFTPGVFPGDESTNWDAGHGLPSVIPAMLNLSLSGCYAFTTDVGGYFDFVAPRTSEELFIRWSQLAALTPVMRIHNSTFNGSVFPWTWEDGKGPQAKAYDTAEIFRRYARLKVRLIPLVDAWAAMAATTGDIGPVRPLILEDLSAAAMAVDYQWLLGEDLLVAPVVQEAAREQIVYFPSGARWMQVRVNDLGELVGGSDIFEGGSSATVPLDAELADIPLFIRCGGAYLNLPRATGFTGCN